LGLPGVPMTETVRPTEARGVGHVSDPSVELKHILFVDDDRYLLEGLRDALRPHRRRWKMSFVSSGEEAMTLLAEQEHDIVISDLRMPGIDGATLLAQVREEHPTTVRIVLSGQAELGRPRGR
jgi:DNA-binding NtrC family response regulator